MVMVCLLIDITVFTLDNRCQQILCVALYRILKLLQCLVCASMQRRLTFQWDVWDGPPLHSLATLDQATCRFLQTAAAALTSSSTHPRIR